MNHFSIIIVMQAAGDFFSEDNICRMLINQGIVIDWLIIVER
jgi:hypothetical protein